MEVATAPNLTTSTAVADSDSRLDKQLRFIELRAKDVSYKAIAAELGVSKGTLTSWDKLLRSEIAKHKAERLGELYEEYGMLKQARIKRYGEIVKRIDAEIDKRDLADLPLDKLLEQKLKFSQVLTSEYTPTRGDKTSQELNSDRILQDIQELLYKVQNGELDKDQAQQELMILGGMLRTYETTVLEAKIDKLQRVMGN